MPRRYKLPLALGCGLAVCSIATDSATDAGGNAGSNVSPPTSQPRVLTPLGTAVGTVPAPGVERYGGIPYALPPIGPKRFGRAELDTRPWAGGLLNATRLGPPCIQNPLGDPRSLESESDAPREDCLTLNVWRPAKPKVQGSLQPVMVYLFGGGLCGGFAGNENYHGTNLAAQHDVVVVTVQYRLGALGFAVGDDPARPGSGGMNGIYDNVVALQWLQRFASAFGGNPNDITLFGQSSGGYSTCALSVAPAAKGLFRRAVIQSGPCFGGPPGRGWGPGAEGKGLNVTQELLRANGVRTLEGLRNLPADQVQWPDEWMNDLAKAPYFSGYFEDDAVLPRPPAELWSEGAINPEEIIVSFTSKDGTAAFYGTAPTLGLVAPDQNTNNPEGYEKQFRAAWGEDAVAVMAQYPLGQYPSASAAFVQADADAYVICPSRRLTSLAARAGRRVFVSEFAHFQPNPTMPVGCTGFGPEGCKGFGCDNGVELDVVPGRHAAGTELWASHGADPRYVFGTERGPDGLGPPFNVTTCPFDAGEAVLSKQVMAHWASFARLGDPNMAAAPGAVHWPAVHVDAQGRVAIQRLRFSVAATDGTPTGLQNGINDVNCDFWDALYPPSEPLTSDAAVLFA